MRNPDELLSRMNVLFGGYRAESLKDELFDVFSAPSFFPELQTSRACLLVGGRGTGKTTLLRALSFEGQFALHGATTDAARNLPFVGTYLRVDLNKTAAFDGPEVDERKWKKIFGHYINLELAAALTEYAVWFVNRADLKIELSREALDEICTSLHLSPVGSIGALAAELRRKRIVLEASINNIGDATQPLALSLQGSPLNLLLDALRATPALSGKDLFFLIDEYESLLPYQQQCINTLVKYSGEKFSFKIGMKELGLHTAATLNESETLSFPADYSRIDISAELENVFETFAHSVVLERFKLVFPAGDSEVVAPSEYFLGLSEEEEAALLGVSDRAAHARERLARENATKEDRDWFAGTTEYLQAFLSFLADSLQSTIVEQIMAARTSRSQFDQRRNNYGYAFLFTLRRKRAGIRKYYAGWSTLCSLAGCNIRYLLHLVDQCVLLAADGLEDITRPLPPDVQTRAAQAVGRSILTDLEGESREGARLTKLLLGLGRIFQVMAATPEGHTPEVNQFSIRKDNTFSVEDEGELEELLRTAVMHLALRRLSGTKPTGEQDTRAWDFTPHPVFAAYFCYSHRKKRKIGIGGGDLLELARHPGVAVSRILLEQRRQLDEIELPEQMQLFEEAFARPAL